VRPLDRTAQKFSLQSVARTLIIECVTDFALVRITFLTAFVGGFVSTLFASAQVDEIALYSAIGIALGIAYVLLRR
jgi:hypothetical protein